MSKYPNCTQTTSADQVKDASDETLAVLQSDLNIARDLFKAEPNVTNIRTYLHARVAFVAAMAAA